MAMSAGGWRKQANKAVLQLLPEMDVDLWVCVCLSLGMGWIWVSPLPLFISDAAAAAAAVVCVLPSPHYKTLLGSPDYLSLLLSLVRLSRHLSSAGGCPVRFAEIWFIFCEKKNVVRLIMPIGLNKPTTAPLKSYTRMRRRYP
jgi:hypothetical protein